MPRRNRLPVAPSRPGLVLAAIAGALFAVARATGSGWLVVLLSGLAATFVVAALAPLWPLWRVRVGARPRTTDATAHRPFGLTLTVHGRGGGLRLRPADPDGPEVAVDAPAEGDVEVVASRRGVLDAAAVEVRSAAPLGLARWRRRVRVPLAPAVDVGPWPADEAVAVPSFAPAGTEEATGSGRDGDLTRSPRSYIPGDALRLLHWPATARTGDLMVRELEAPAAAALALVVDLRGPSELAEAAASRAAGLALTALRRGVAVSLLTAEAGGPMAGPVRSPVEVGRRLARAVARPPAEGPVEAGAAVVRIAATDLMP
jgi:uncharacterized protein (DUF58 family)